MNVILVLGTILGSSALAALVAGVFGERSARRVQKRTNAEAEQAAAEADSIRAARIRADVDQSLTTLRADLERCTRRAEKADEIIGELRGEMRKLEDERDSAHEQIDLEARRAEAAEERARASDRRADAAEEQLQLLKRFVELAGAWFARHPDPKDPPPEWHPLTPA